MNIVLNSKNPKLATLFPGPVCNLACTTCSDQVSTRWQAITGKRPTSLNRNIKVSDLNFDGIESLVICGGEPILHKSTEEVVEYLTDTNIRLIIHFNGTVLPSETFLSKVAKYNREVTFRFSIDGIGNRFDYLRWPGKWVEVEQNLQWIRNHAPDNVTFGITCTISMLNKDTHYEVAEWVSNNFSTNRLGAKIVVDTQLAHNFLNPEFAIPYYDNLDAVRNTNWRDTFEMSNDI